MASLGLRTQAPADRPCFVMAVSGRCGTVTKNSQGWPAVLCTMTFVPGGALLKVLQIRLVPWHRGRAPRARCYARPLADTSSSIHHLSPTGSPALAPDQLYWNHPRSLFKYRSQGLASGAGTVEFSLLRNALLVFGPPSSRTVILKK